MAFPVCRANGTGRGHGKLDVYRLAIDCVAWVYRQANELGGFIDMRATNGFEPVSR